MNMFIIKRHLKHKVYLNSNILFWELQTAQTVLTQIKVIHLL